MAGCAAGSSADEPPKKRPRLVSLWDILPSGHKAEQIQGFDGQTLKRYESGSAPRPAEICSENVFSSAVKCKGERPFRYMSPPQRNDDNEGHYMFSFGENLTPRYKILCKMGQGTFGQVLECWDRKNKDFVAIKVARGLQKYREEAQIEIDVLREVAKYDKDGKR